MVASYASNRTDIELVVVDTSPKWRSIHSTGFLIRAIGGGFQLLMDVFRLVKTLSVSRFDAVHLTTPGRLAIVRDLVVSYVAQIFNTRFIYHIRFGRIPAIAQANSIEWRIIRKVMLNSSVVILIDKATYSAVKRFVPGANAVLIPNCVNITNFPANEVLSSEVKTLLFVGWVIPTKGIGELVEAWSRLKPQGWRLDIVGPGELDYQAQLQQKFQPENLVFVGELSHTQTMARMANCDLFVLPSYSEGFPNVVVEAMALGRPIVATEVGAIPEMLEGNAGVLVKSKDVEALTEALNRLILDSQSREIMGREAHAKVMRLYTIDVVFQAYMQIWCVTPDFVME